MQKTAKYFLLLLLMPVAAFATNYVTMSSKGLSNTKAQPFSFSVNHGSRINVSANHSTLFKTNKPITNVSVYFGTSLDNAILPSCHRIIPEGFSGKAYMNPESKKSYEVYSQLARFEHSIPINDPHSVSFTLIGLSRMYCAGDGVGCQVYDCFES